MKTPTSAQLRIAADWLDASHASEDKAACDTVAAWLNAKANEIALAEADRHIAPRVTPLKRIS